MKKQKENSAPESPLPSAGEVYELIKKQQRPLRLDALYRILHLPRQANRKLVAMLDELANQGLIVRMPGGLWLATASLKKITGRFQAQGQGGVVVPEGDRIEEIAIPPMHTGDAWHKDLVEVALLPGAHARQGKIIRVVERRQKEVTARVVKVHKNEIVCKATDRRLRLEFIVPVENRAKLKPGLLVALHPYEKISNELWRASLVNIFGSENRIQVQESLVKSNHQAPGEFPPLALKQAESLPEAPTKEDMAGREDWRQWDFVTIDGKDARDFDDAIHVEKTESGFILRVAIADVSFYVRPDPQPGSLDEEARKRGNSWYFPQSVEPMLPKALSNGLCSLRPGEDRLAVMAEMPFDRAGKPLKPRFAQIVMRSRARLIYDNVARFFNGSQDMEPELAPMLSDALELYKLLAARRRERGSLEFELPEPAYTFDAEGRLLSMRASERNLAHLLIEEFMIATNEAVAEFLEERHAPFLYRCHPAPEAMKAEKLYDTLIATSLEILPPSFTMETLGEPRTYQHILDKARGTPKEYVVDRLCLRSMSQARYQPINVGHFGLASRSYCHFTSPIRRYADLMTHRALKHTLGYPQKIIEDQERLAEIGEDINKTERAALECEREMARRLGCLALKAHEGEWFEGVISGVTDFGLFVELKEIPTEGMIRLENLGNDWYILDQRSQTLTGERTGQTWRLGQPVSVKVNSVDLDRLETRLAPRLPQEDGVRQKRRGRTVPHRQERKPTKKASKKFH